MDHRKRKPQRKPPGSNRRKRPDKDRRPATSAIKLRPLAAGGGFELVHPPCARARAEDLEEVEVMLKAGELEIAKDEIRWLLDGCHALLAGHALLGEIALEENDIELARGHFGYAYQLGAAALPSGRVVSLPYAAPANRAFFEAGKGLAWCLNKQGETALAADVIERLLALDPLDPLNLRGMGEGRREPGDGSREPGVG